MTLRAVLLVGGVIACAPPALPRSASPVTVAMPTGAWQRDWIERRGAARDAIVAVRYVQTPSVFGDVRIRGDRPDLAHASSFDELRDDELLALARQSGFAGTTTIDGAQATWHHEIDFQPASSEPDIGRIEPVGRGRMFEHALDGAYVESWSALELAGDGAFAARVERAGRVQELLAVAGGHFVYARARAADLPAGESLVELIARTRPARDRLIAYLDCEISYGTTREWRIERSTLPWRQGKRLAMVDRIALGPEGQAVARAAAAGEVWSFPVDSLAPEARRAMFPGGR